MSLQEIEEHIPNKQTRKKKQSLNGTNNQNKFSFNENKTQQINSFEYLNPNYYNQEPYQKFSQKIKKKTIPKISLNSKSKSNLSFKPKTKPNKSKPPLS